MEQPRASKIEILGSWLHLWTAPRDVYVPPVPWRKVAYAAAAFLAVVVFVALVIAPIIDEGKDKGAAERQRVEQQQKAARVAAQRREQRAITGELTSLTQVEQTIGLDAKRRFGTDGRPAACEPFPGQPATSRSLLYDCHVTVRELVTGGMQKGAQGALTVPYRARLDEKADRYAFCKVNPRPGEQAILGPDSIVQLPKPCRAY